MTLTKTLPAGAAVLTAIGLITACSGSTEARADPQVAPTAIAAPIAFQTAEFAIENMTCASCPITVRKAMERVPGVQSVDIDFKTKTATVSYDPAITTPADIAAAPTANGYPATLTKG